MLILKGGFYLFAFLTNWNESIKDKKIMVGYSEQRNKRKDKRREKKKHPYKHGGKYRASAVKE